MEKGRDNITAPVVGLMLGLWRRADRDFSTKAARKAFRETCAAVLAGDAPPVAEPQEDISHDSPEWARFVAAEDCQSVKAAMDNIAAMSKIGAMMAGMMTGDALDESDSDDGMQALAQYLPFKPFKRRRKSDPTRDRRYKANKTEEERERQRLALDDARAKAVALANERRGYPLYDPPVIDEPQAEGAEDSQTQGGESAPPEEGRLDIETPKVDYMERRKKNSKPKIVPIPPLPTDYKLENEWVKANIKSPDMLYSYVVKKTGGGVTWSGGLRKYFNSNDFWEFAFDTLSSGGWNDSETNKPISNVSKYITKATIGEYTRHERSKYSIFDGKFKTGKELLEYIDLHCSAMDEKYRTEEYAEWFLQQMNDVGWRFNNGSTINNLSKAMSDKFDAFQEWCKNNSSNLAGLNPNQYGETLRIQKAIERGEWKPTAEGKFRAIDLLKFAQKKS